MIRWFITTILILVGTLSYIAASWFEAQELQNEALSETYRTSIKELRNIKQTNEWLKHTIIPYFNISNYKQEHPELSIIHFYDQYFKLYNFKVAQFIYYNGSANMDIEFSFQPKDSNDLYHFLQLKYPDGFVKITSLSYQDGKATGILTIIHPLSEDYNATSSK